MANGNYFILTAHHASPTTINPDSELKNPPQDWAMQTILQLGTVVLFGLLSILTVRAAFRASFIEYDNGTEYLVYAH